MEKEYNFEEIVIKKFDDLDKKFAKKFKGLNKRFNDLDKKNSKKKLGLLLLL